MEFVLNLNRHLFLEMSVESLSIDIITILQHQSAKGMLTDCATKDTTVSLHWTIAKTFASNVGSILMLFVHHIYDL